MHVKSGDPKEFDVPQVFGGLKVISVCMNFDDPKEFDDPKAFNDPKRSSIVSMDYDNLKVYGDGHTFSLLG